MNTRFWCARCGRAYERPRELAGRRVRCLACGHVQTIPEPVELPESDPSPSTTNAAAGGMVVPPPVSTSPSTSTYALASAPGPAAVPGREPELPRGALVLPAVPSSAREPAGPRRCRPVRGQQPASWRDHLRDITGGAGRLQELSLVLLALSLLDLFVTFALLRTSPRFYEANPVAMWFFRRWNIAGMAFFKLGAIAVAIALGEVIERHRPGWGKAVLVIGCAATAAVAWHGLRLYLGLGPLVEAGAD